ncbi:helix-turn-helix domain-containing protein [Fodinibius halophilus]|uniref:Helix-turn-helix domain-containing protein n=1 Tax=Fodinibius halophilus TaxID=1736908 RepID=A0A6M1TI62_9BACT|nr:helix-turn-helix domain-containing protein [Fodinibius halophilus]NGP89762.1 helix-turn-helix domain-containing protein [Fodinibius halophilus]
MRSMFSLEEVGEMLDMKTSEVEREIESGHLTYSFHDGEKRITLYDLEKYMGAEQTRKITQDYLGEGEG